jgi:HSP20 family molecular chaperone IbpA
MNTNITKRGENRAETVEQRPATAPRVDIYENKDELLLIADMPGVSESGLTIRLDEEQLEIHGRPIDLPSAGRPLAREFRQLDYRRSFLVPHGIDRDRIDAKLKDGVLWLHLPKSEAVKPRQIAVKAG